MAADERKRGADALYGAARSRISEALTAWIAEDFDRAAASAPMGCELLGKAALWAVHPTLLLPLQPQQEAALVSLATAPNLSSASLRTVGLADVLSRLTRVHGDLPVPKSRQKRLLDCRNGSIHVGTLPRHGDGGAETTARQVLSDCLLLCNFLLQQIHRESSDFYGENRPTVNSLLNERNNEVQHKVARLLARAEDHVSKWRGFVDDDELWRENAQNLEHVEVDMLGSDVLGLEEGALRLDCPCCGFTGHLLGRVDVTDEVDFDVEDGMAVPVPYFVIDFHPRGFYCNVCKLHLGDTAELSAVSIATSSRTVEEAELGEAFRAAEWADALYGLRD